MILISGASGAVGVPTIRHLVKRGARVRALTSSGKSATRLKSLGVAETVIGDWRNAADLNRAMEGTRSVMHIPPRFTEDEVDIGLRVLAAAKSACIDHFVFSSAYHPQMRKMDHHWAKLLVEEAVIESGLAFTILQPAMFMQNLRVEWPVVKERGVYLRPYSPDRKMALIDTDDLGEVAARVLIEPGFRGATFELAGPDSLTTAEMAAILAEASGKPIRAEQRPLDDWTAWAVKQGWKPWAIEAYRKMCGHYDAHGYPGGNPLVLEAILGRPAGTYRAFAQRFIAEQSKA